MTFSRLNFFRTPSPAALAAAELDEAQRELLEARSGQEYASAMCDYHEARVTRLRAFLAEHQRSLVEQRERAGGA